MFIHLFLFGGGGKNTFRLVWGGTGIVCEKSTPNVWHPCGKVPQTLSRRMSSTQKGKKATPCELPDRWKQLPLTQPRLERTFTGKIRTTMRARVQVSEVLTHPTHPLPTAKSSHFHAGFSLNSARASRVETGSTRELSEKL